MNKNYSHCRVIGIYLSVVFVFFLATPIGADITPTDPYQADALASPDPAVKTWDSSIAYYNNHLIYAGDDNSIYAYNLDTEGSTLVCDLSANANFGFGPAGFFISNDGYLYFIDNGTTTNIYRALLSEEWPVNYESFDTQCDSSIFAFTQNPWTEVIWFASADFFGSGNNMYLYEVNGFSSVTQMASFAAPHGGGNGPLIFKEATTLLYGESVWGGDGYFHLMDSTTGDISTQDYLTFDSGLVGATYGYDNMIYATTGGGKNIYEIQDNEKTQVATTDEDVQGIAFDGTSFFVSEQKSSDSSGEIGFHKLWKDYNGAEAEGDGGAGGCFIQTTVSGSPSQNWNACLLFFILVLIAGIYLAIKLPWTRH
jgi:hypothetical protein